jgi:hypothetical protein
VTKKVDENYQIYSKVAVLRGGNCFGHNPKDNRSFILVSNGATIAKFQINEIKKFEFFEKIINFGFPLMDDDSIAAKFMDMNKVRKKEEFYLST